MEIKFLSTPLLLAFLIFIFMVLKIAKKTNSKLPPGPWKLPLIGNMHQLALSGPLPHRTLRKMAGKYGPLMHIKLGQVSTIVVTSPEIAKEDMFSGGSETSSTIVEWAMSELLKAPQLMKRAQDEVRNFFDKKGNVDEASLQELKYLNSVIKETLRLHPAAPLLLPRESSEKCILNGYEIPAKTKVIVNAWAIGRDTAYWTEAEKFDPERFVNSEIDYRGRDFEYIPFGAGRRICPGMSFALPNMQLPLAQLLYHFDWKLPNGMKHEELDMEEQFGLTVRRKHDLYLIPIPYNPISSVQ